MCMNNFFLSVFTSSPLPRPQDAVVEGGVLLLPLSTVLFFRLGTRPRLVRGWAEKITPCDYFLPNTRMWSSARFCRETERKKLFIPSTHHSGVFCIVALAGKPVLLLSPFPIRWGTFLIVDATQSANVFALHLFLFNNPSRGRCLRIITIIFPYRS